MRVKSTVWAISLGQEAMASARCPRVWEAEPVSDGRLGGAERFSFELHVRGCVVCQREMAALSSLEATTRELAALKSTRFERQRLRGRLLRRANQELFRTAPRVQAGWVAVAAVSLALVGMALGWVGG